MTRALTSFTKILAVLSALSAALLLIASMFWIEINGDAGFYLSTTRAMSEGLRPSHHLPRLQPGHEDR